MSDDEFQASASAVGDESPVIVCDVREAAGPRGEQLGAGMLLVWRARGAHRFAYRGQPFDGIPVNIAVMLVVGLAFIAGVHLQWPKEWLWLLVPGGVAAFALIWQWSPSKTRMREGVLDADTLVEFAMTPDGVDLALAPGPEDFGICRARCRPRAPATAEDLLRLLETVSPAGERFTGDAAELNGPAESVHVAWASEALHGCVVVRTTGSGVGEMDWHPASHIRDTTPWLIIALTVLTAVVTIFVQWERKGLLGVLQVPGVLLLLAGALIWRLCRRVRLRSFTAPLELELVLRVNRDIVNVQVVITPPPNAVRRPIAELPLYFEMIGESDAERRAAGDAFMAILAPIAARASRDQSPA